MLFAQADTVVNIIDRFGVSVGMLAFFVLGSAWIAKRLFNEKNGLFTFYVSKTTETMESISGTCQQQAETQIQLTALCASSDKRLKTIEETGGRLEMLHYDPNTHFATRALSRCFLHGCDVLEAVSDKLEISEKTKPLLKIMRSELKEHERAANKTQEN